MKTTKINFIREDKSFTANLCITKKSLNEIETYKDDLHPQEHLYLGNLKYPKRKQSYLLGRIATKQAITELIPLSKSSIWIDFGIFQFPVIKSSSIQNMNVSISHCNDLGTAIAFPEEHPIGIDLEKISNDKLELLKKELIAEERILLKNNKLDDIIGYVTFWTIKEALSKIFKIGLTSELSLLSIHKVENNYPIIQTEFTNFSQYKSVSFIMNSYILSIVIPKKSNFDRQSVREFLEGSEVD